jgi:hypothetical protein
MADPTKPKGPDAPSSDYLAAKPAWDMANDIMGGADDMRAGGEKYLPRFINEDKQEYACRLKKAPFTNLYADVLRNLACKPFAKELLLKDGAPASIVEMADDIDGQGNSLHIYASELFQNGINKGIDWIGVDYPKMAAGSTLADERSIGARPYWVRISAERVLAVYSDFEKGKEIFTHARIYEPTLERDGFDERLIERVRVFDRAKGEIAIGGGLTQASYAGATSTLWELQQDRDKIRPPQWVIIEGPLPVTIGEIPLVPFITGERCGAGWAIEPPLRDIAHAQVKEYQLEGNLDYVLDMTAFPMLVGNGVDQKNEQGVDIKIPVGPRAVLFAPPDSEGKHGEWSWIEPDAASIGKLMEHLETTRKELRDLGMQPLLPKTGNLTATATALAGAKAHCAVQAWALALEDTLERALAMSAKWLGDTTQSEVSVHTDFDAGIDVPTELATILDMRKNNDLSQDTMWAEFKRRGVLSDDFDPAIERPLIAANPMPAANGAIDVQVPRS